MYVLLNRNNIVVDILSEARYIKLQSLNGIVVACDEKEGTGIIGSDCNTYYTLIKADILNQPNSVTVLQLDIIPSNVIPKYSKYNPEDNSFSMDLDQAKYDKQEENKRLFVEYLATHPLIWIDGKKYGITLEDQSEINFNINQYQIAIQSGVENPTLEWHAQHEENISWNLNDLLNLNLSISNVVYSKYHKMQSYKNQIFKADTIEELQNIKINFE